MGHNYAQIGGKITPNFLQCTTNNLIITQFQFDHKLTEDV